MLFQINAGINGIDMRKDKFQTVYFEIEILVNLSIDSIAFVNYGQKTIGKQY
jgi:hypothetical protein